MEWRWRTALKIIFTRKVSAPMAKYLIERRRMKPQSVAVMLSIYVALYSAPPCTAPTSAESVALQNWPSLGRNAYQQGFSPLRKVSSTNAKRLGLAWSADIPAPDGMVGEPLVEDGVVYQGGAMGMVFANDLRTGNLIWKYVADVHYRPNDKWGAYWGTRTNRGLALWRDEVIFGVGDCRLIALDRKTGNKIWETVACDPTHSETLTDAPRVGDGKVFMGMAISEYGARGHIDAYDARTGKRLWRFYTVPGEETNPEIPQADPAALTRAAKTWGKDYTPRGGAPWQSIIYDPKTKLVLFGTGEPAESNLLKRGRDPGDELYTDSIVALKADTGKLAWYYKQTPDDVWNYDATDAIILADLEINGKLRHVAMQAPKNGFFYVLDATNGSLLSANNIVPVNWASHIDLATGRPVQRPDAQWYRYPNRWTLIEPNGPMSGAHWPIPMSYSPLTHLVYIPAAYQSTLVRFDPRAYMGGLLLKDTYAPLHDTRLRSDGVLIAWDPVTQHERWKWKATSLIVGGTLSTAGNLVFAGTGNGLFSAFAADTGQVLWSFNSHQCIEGAPITVESQGRQLILVSSGNCATGGPGRVMPLLLTKNGHLPPGPSRLLAFELGGHAVLPPVDKPAPFPKPPLPRFPLEEARRGGQIYDATGCQECHGAMAVAALGGSVPDLREAPAETYSEFTAIVFGALASGGMPSWAGTLTPKDAELIKAFVIDEAWNAYEAGGIPSTDTEPPDSRN